MELTKREQFAAMAMQGICVNAGRNGHTFHDIHEITKTAFQIADSMLLKSNNNPFVYESNPVKSYAEYLQNRPDYLKHTNKNLAIDYLDSL
jgi:hypothetical protein